MSKGRNVTKKNTRRRYGGNNTSLGNTIGTGINTVTSTADSAAGTIIGTFQDTGKWLGNTASGVATGVGSKINEGANMFNATVDSGINTVTNTVGDVGNRLKKTFIPDTTGGVMMNSNPNPNIPLYNQEEEEEKPWWKFWGGRRRKTKKRNNKRRNTSSYKRKNNKSKRKVNKRRSNKKGGAKVPVHDRGHHARYPPYLAKSNHLQGLSPSAHNSKLTMSRMMKGGRGPAEPWVPQDLVNAYRGTIGMGVDAINTWQGRPEDISVNPYPTQKQLYKQDIKILNRKYPNISANYDTATSTVAAL